MWASWKSARSPLKNYWRPETRFADSGRLAVTKALGSDLARINKAGIPIMVLDCNAQTVTKHSNQPNLLTAPDRPTAKKRTSWRRTTNIADAIQARVKKPTCPSLKGVCRIRQQKALPNTVYLRQKHAGPMVTLVGGNNIATSSVEFYGPINPESPRRQTRRDRDYRPRNRSEENPAAMVMGWSIPAKAEKRLAGFAKRAGWANLPAIKTTASMPPTTPTRARCPTAHRFSLWPKRFIRSCSKTSIPKRLISTSTAKTCWSCRTVRSICIRKVSKGGLWVSDDLLCGKSSESNVGFGPRMTFAGMTAGNKLYRRKRLIVSVSEKSARAGLWVSDDLFIRKVV